MGCRIFSTINQMYNLFVYRMKYTCVCVVYKCVFQTVRHRLWNMHIVHSANVLKTEMRIVSWYTDIQMNVIEMKQKPLDRFTQSVWQKFVFVKPLHIAKETGNVGTMYRHCEPDRQIIEWNFHIFTFLPHNNNTVADTCYTEKMFYQFWYIYPTLCETLFC